MMRIGLAFVGIFAMNAILWAAIAWATASVGTSILKSIKNDCDSQYQIETLPIHGSLFCDKWG